MVGFRGRAAVRVRRSRRSCSDRHETTATDLVRWLRCEERSDEPRNHLAFARTVRGLGCVAVAKGSDEEGWEAAGSRGRATVRMRPKNP
jgi:hypothetical protein